jgi:ribosome-associated protein
MHDHSTDETESTRGEVPSPDQAPSGMPKRLRHTYVAQDETPTRAVRHSDPARLARALEHARFCAGIASLNRARDIVVLDMRSSTPLVDYFVIATAGSRRQAAAIADEISVELKRKDELKLGIEGVEDGRWILMDYGDFVVHIFEPETRAYYGLEEIWADAEPVTWEELPRPGGPPSPMSISSVEGPGAGAPVVDPDRDDDETVTHTDDEA